MLFHNQKGYYYSFILQLLELLHGRAEPANNLDCLKLIHQHLLFYFGLAYMYVCTYVHVRMYPCIHVCMYACTHEHMYACTYVRTYVRTYIRWYVRTYVRMYVCICNRNNLQHIYKHSTVIWRFFVACLITGLWASFTHPSSHKQRTCGLL